MVVAVVYLRVAAERGVAPRRWWRPVGRYGTAAVLLALLAARLGSRAFARGIDSLTASAIVAAVALTALSTLCAAWRWRLVACRLGAPLSFTRAVGAYYRSQLLNSVLPGGVVGDAQRAVAHGRDVEVDDVGRATRAVVWERTCGQVVQAVVTVAVLALLPSPGRRFLPLILVIIGCVFLAAWRVRRVRRAGSSWWARLLGGAGSDLRAILAWPLWPKLALASLGVVVSHVLLYVWVAHLVAPSATFGELAPLGVIVLLAAGVPLSVAGWGLREGTAAWAFAAAGLGASAGVAASVAYGVVSLIALLPGAGLLATDLLRRGRTSPARTARATPHARQEVMSHG